MRHSRVPIGADRDPIAERFRGEYQRDRPDCRGSLFDADSHRIVCGPTGTDRDELSAGYRDANRLLAGVPPGTIIRPRLP